VSAGRKRRDRLDARRKDFDASGLAGKPGFRRPGSTSAHKSFPARKRGR